MTPHHPLDAEGDTDGGSVRDLAALPGLGERTAAMLVGVGVRSPDDLDRVGPVAVYVRLRQAYRGVSRNFLHALEAIDAGCSWRDITPERKRLLDAEVAAAEVTGRPPGTPLT